jgi:hypothetical protein
MNIAKRLIKFPNEKAASPAVSFGLLASAAICSNIIGPPAALAQLSVSQAQPGESLIQTLSDWQICFARGSARDRAVALAACDRISASQESLPPDLLQKARDRLERRRRMILEGTDPAPNPDATASSKK